VFFIAELEPIFQIGLEYSLLADKEKHQYQLLVSGWQQLKRVHGIVAQMDIRDNLIWVQEDGTDIWCGQ
jgi:hypothetical protein